MIRKQLDEIIVRRPTSRTAMEFVPTSRGLPHSECAASRPFYLPPSSAATAGWICTGRRSCSYRAPDPWPRTCEAAGGSWPVCPDWCRFCCNTCFLLVTSRVVRTLNLPPLPDAGQRVAAADVHGAWPADAFATGPSESESGVDLVLDFDQGVQHHRPAAGPRKTPSDRYLNLFDCVGPSIGSATYAFKSTS